MKIGIDCRLWGESGVGRYIQNLVRELSKIDKVNQYVLFLRDINEVRPRKLPDNWRLVKVDIRWHTIEEQIKFPRILYRENLDLIHFPYFNVPIFYRDSFVVTIHDLIISHFPTGRATTLPWPLYQAKRLGYKIALNHAIKNSRKVITVSEATKKEIIDHFEINPSKIVVTYESGELDVNNETMKQLSNYQLVPTPYFLYVGNAHPHKNLERLLEAILNVKCSAKDGLSVKLVLVGRQDYFYQRLKEKAKEISLKGAVVFYGEATDSELLWLYKNAQALILPSLMEGFGLPALEAMSQSCLVLASDIPALREVCGNAAIYFDPLKTQEITKKIEAVCYHDLNHSIKISEGLRRAKMFSWEKMAKETLETYKNI